MQNECVNALQCFIKIAMPTSYSLTMTKHPPPPSTHPSVIPFYIFDTFFPSKIRVIIFPLHFIIAATRLCGFSPGPIKRPSMCMCLVFLQKQENFEVREVNPSVCPLNCVSICTNSLKHVLRSPHASGHTRSNNNASSKCNTLAHIEFSLDI